MTKQDYMDKLREKLAGFDEDIRSEIVSDYEEHFRMGEVNGKSEAQICEELGSIDELVDELNKLTGKSVGGRGIHIDEEQIRQAADTIGRTMSDTMKNIAGFLGSFAASVSRGTSKFTSNVGEKAGKFSEKAGDMAENFTEKAGDFAGNVSDKAEDYFSAFKNGFESAAEKIANKSEAFAKEIAESYRKAMNNEAAKASAEAEQTGSAEESCAAGAAEAAATDSGENTCTPDRDNTSCQEAGAYNADKCDSVVVQTDCGDVVVEASEDGQVHVDYYNGGTVNQQLAYGFDFKQEGSTVYAIAKKRPGTSNFFKSMSCPDITVTVKIPEGLKNVSIRTLSGDVEGSDMNVAQLSINTMSGDVSLDNCLASECQIATMSGDIGFDDCSFVSGKCSTVSGDINSDSSVLQTFDSKTTSGDIDLSDTATRDLNAETVSGDIDIELAGGDGYLAHVKTTCGDVRLDYNDESIEIIRSGSYVMGAGDIKLNLSSVSGDITVEGCV